MVADFFGTRVLNSSLGQYVFPAVLSNQPMLTLGNVDLPHSYGYMSDIARGVLAIWDICSDNRRRAFCYEEEIVRGSFERLAKMNVEERSDQVVRCFWQMMITGPSNQMFIYCSIREYIHRYSFHPSADSVGDTTIWT